MKKSIRKEAHMKMGHKGREIKRARKGMRIS